jgi:Tol biopolymer transport system component
MSITIGSLLGSYEITSPLGEGGMGVVYRARDTKLGRDVAIKVLPDAFAGDPDRLQRFRREAQVLASLNHSNIAQIYGLEESGSTCCIVMELVGGETLQERLNRGPIPLDEALPIVKQIAEALEAAHEKGIIHRDLKPANIKVEADGKVKVLDFGLAKAFYDQQPATLSNSPTLMSASLPGVILGTAAYMSPEQAKGKETDRTSDVWAFACVVYEILAGRPVFQGETIGEILAEIFKTVPDWNRLPSETPAAIRRLLRRCLEKDRTLRLRDMGDARLEIHDAQSGIELSAGMAPAASRRRERYVWIASLAFVVVMATAIVLWVRQRPFSVQKPPEVRLEIATPPAREAAAFSISPDGRKVVYEGVTDGVTRLWLRSLDSVAARPLENTVGARFPFWSTDSRSVGFFGDGKLNRIDIDTGFVQTLTTISGAPRGGTWSREGIILFAASSGLLRISANGGNPMPVLAEPGPQVKNFPEFLPDGQHFLYHRSIEPRGVYLGQLDGSETRRLVDSDFSAVYAQPGHLLFVKQGTLFAQEFDSVRLVLSGNPVAIAGQVSISPTSAKVPVSASAAGPILYRAGFASFPRQFVWFDRSGKELERVGPADSRNSMEPALSPDGRRVALRRTVDGNTDIWLLQVDRGILSRFTSDDLPESNPVWSPDDSRIVFGSPRKTANGLYLKSVNDAAKEELLISMNFNMSALDWSPDGHFVLFRVNDPKNEYDLWSVPVDGDRKAFPIVQTSANEPDGQFSPDGKWIAYQSADAGRFEIYVQPFPGPGSKIPISSNGGTQVRWPRDSKELFYIALDGRLMAVPIRLAKDGKTIEPGAPVPLFATHIGGAYSDTSRPQYVVSRDGQRFLMNTVIEESAASSLTVILNWRPERGK